jgi:hypothetical protein
MEFIIFFILFLAIGWYSTTGIKTQLVRLADVFIYGPLLIWISTRTKSVWERIALLFMGATTMTYNLRNYLVVGKMI